jgi:hypothetical protein
MFNSFYQARDELDRAVLAGHFDKLPGISLAIFRYLLEHTFYTERSYGFVNHKRCGVQTLMAYTNFSKNAVTNALTNLEQAHLIHRRPRPMGTGGSNPDEITITWPVFHAEDEAEGPSEGLSDRAEGPSQDSEGPSEGLSFLDKNLKNGYNNKADAVAAPSGEDRAKGSTRSKGSARSGSTRAKDDCPVDGFASVEEYVLDLEGCVGQLELRLFSVDDGQIDVKTLARKLRTLCIQYEVACKWSDILRVFPSDDKIWWQAGRKEVPAGYLLTLIELDMIELNKERAAEDDGPEADEFPAPAPAPAKKSAQRVEADRLVKEYAKVSGRSVKDVMDEIVPMDLAVYQVVEMLPAWIRDAEAAIERKTSRGSAGTFAC